MYSCGFQVITDHGMWLIIFKVTNYLYWIKSWSIEKKNARSFVKYFLRVSFHTFENEGQDILKIGLQTWPYSRFFKFSFNKHVK